MVRVVGLLLLCVPAMGQPSNAGLHELFDRFYEDYLQQNPELATSVGRTEHDTRWRDWSSEARQSWADRVERYLADLREFDPQSLNAQDRISAALLREQLDTEREGMRYEAYLLRLNQLFGLHTSVLLTIREMPTRSEADYENMLARLRALPDYVSQNIAVLREAIQEGIMQPRLIVDLVVGQLAAQSEAGPADSPLLTPFRQIPATISQSRRRELVSEAERAYRDGFQPSWRELARFLAEEYAPHARSTLAVTGLPSGDAIYKFFVAHHTTLPLSADEIHSIGRREVARIEQAMEAIAREAGFDGHAAAYEQHLRTAPEYLFSDKESMLSYHRDLALRVSPELPRPGSPNRDLEIS